MKFELKKINRGAMKDYRNVTDADLISDLQEVAKKLKKDSVTHSEYDGLGKFNSHVFGRRFGGWNDALNNAGLKVGKKYNTSEEDAFKNIEEIWIKLGRQPLYAEIQKPLSRLSMGFYEYRFGSWYNALEKFVAFINKEENVPSEKIIKGLKVESSTKHRTSRTINWRIRFIVMKRDNFKCKKCGRSPATDPSIVLHIDHIKAWANGGETILENLETLCSKCNIGKSDLE